MGKQVKGIVSHDVYDKEGGKHLGITQMPIPVLGASYDKIKEIRQKLISLDLKDFVMVDFSNIAQQSETYDHYEEVMHTTEENDIRYLSIGICGNKKVINKTTGNLRLIR